MPFQLSIGDYYRIIQKTGDTLEGLVREFNDTALVLENTERFLVLNYASLRTCTPVPEPVLPALPPKTFSESEIISYETLLQDSSRRNPVTVRIRTGSTFKGSITAIDTQSIKINVSGSEVSIERSLITAITADQK